MVPGSKTRWRFLMVNITLSIPDDLKQEMEKFPEMNWSVIARAAIKQRILMLEKFREFTKDSTLTEEDAIRLGREVGKRAAEKFRKKSKK
jgi:hypothetical protein